MKNIIVIGGGPAGMIAAGIAAQNGNKVTLIEKNNKLGKKLFITGKGRCNLTNAVDIDGLIENIPGNPYFLYSAFYNLDSFQTMEFFESLGVKLKIERGNRVFPMSEKSSDIVKSLEKFLIKQNVTIHLNTKAEKLILEGKKVKGIILNNSEKLFSDSVIIATGGLSYPVTGSTGDGYRFAKQAGHKITKLYPSLVPLKVYEQWCYELQGLSLKNISVKLKKDNKEIYNDFGEMMFTHFGVTGPVILSSSRYIIKNYNEKHKLIIDLKPALSEKELDTRILRDFEKYKNKDFKNSLDDLLPQKIIPIIIKLSKINPLKKVNSITKDERKYLCFILKNLTLTITGTTGFSEAVVTSGGIETNEIDPSTMKSKIIDNLLFAGEVIDVDGFTGGFNLQIAFSTGYVAGLNA